MIKAIVLLSIIAIAMAAPATDLDLINQVNNAKIINQGTVTAAYASNATAYSVSDSNWSTKFETKDDFTYTTTTTIEQGADVGNLPTFTDGETEVANGNSVQANVPMPWNVRFNCKKAGETKFKTVFGIQKTGGATYDSVTIFYRHTCTGNNLDNDTGDNNKGGDASSLSASVTTPILLVISVLAYFIM